MAQTNTWDVQIGSGGCTNPTGAEGSEQCISGFMNTCTDGAWVEDVPQKSCGGEQCAGQTTPAGCEDAGCYWYAYPNPFGEPACFDQPIYIKYLPIIAVGVGALIVVAALFGSRKTTSYPNPPPYYPPPGGR